jgi:hypothetical protein
VEVKRSDPFFAKLYYRIRLFVEICKSLIFCNFTFFWISVPNLKQNLVLGKIIFRHEVQNPIRPQKGCVRD